MINDVCLSKDMQHRIWHHTLSISKLPDQTHKELLVVLKDFFFDTKLSPFVRNIFMLL